jgi:tRNA(Arg) A34 adenosine deaminase TadA
MRQLGTHEAAAHAQPDVIGLVAKALNELAAAAKQSLEVDFYDLVLLTTTSPYAICSRSRRPLGPISGSFATGRVQRTP